MEAKGPMSPLTLAESSQKKEGHQGWKLNVMPNPISDSTFDRDIRS